MLKVTNSPCFDFISVRAPHIVTLWMNCMVVLNHVGGVFCMLLQHKNATPHTAKEKLTKMRLEISYSQYSQDLDLSDFICLASLKTLSKAIDLQI